MSYAKKARVWGLALVAVFMFSSIAAANASAAEWLLNGSAISTAVPTTGSGTLRLTDTKGGAFGGSVTVECSGTTTGTAGPGKLDTTEKVTVSSCKTVEGVCESPAARAANLPWKTELVTEGGVARDKILSDGNGAPGYEVECGFFGVRATDTCTSETGKPLVEKNKSPVPIVFDEASGNANCSRGGSEQGHVRGTVKVSSSKGTLTVGP